MPRRRWPRDDARYLLAVGPEAVEVLLADIGDAKVVAPLTTYLKLPLRVDRRRPARSMPEVSRGRPRSEVDQHDRRSRSAFALAAEIEQAGRVGVAR